MGTQKNTVLVGLSILSFVGAAKAAQAYDNLFVAGRLYLRAGAGVLLQQDATLSTPGGSVKAGFDPGVRGNLTLGYNISENLALEFETGLLYNSIDKLGGFSISSTGFSIDQYGVPLMANLIYRFNPAGRFVPYITGGVGAVIDTIDINTPIGSASDSAAAFAYQAGAGFEYRFSGRVALDVAYKFLGSADQSFTIEGGKTDVKDIFTHSFIVSVDVAL